MTPAWLLVLAIRAADYTGSAACAPCHPAHARRAAGSRHAMALLRTAETDLGARLSAKPIRDGAGTEFRYQVEANGVRAVVSPAGGAAVSGVLDWIFGAGAQARTMVSLRDGRFWEHRVSWYAAPPGRFALTPGHTPRAPESELFGLIQSPLDAYRCFNCHATNVGRSAAGPELSHMEPGVKCERCHGPGSAHVKANSTAAISNPGRLPARVVVQMCGECHRFPNFTISSPTPELEDPLSVRFQPVGLQASRCFQRSGRLSCLTCHDPHESLRHDDAYYSAKCLGCHGGRAPAGCPRAVQGDCLPCHMPKSSPLPFLTFTDHRIRVAN